MEDGWKPFKPTWTAAKRRKWYQFWKPKLVEIKPEYVGRYKVEGKTVHYQIKSRD